LKSSFEFQPANPFSTERIAPSNVAYRFSHTAGATNPQKIDAHLEGLLSKLRETQRGVIVGPHGTGKSTLLHTFLPKLQRTFPTVAFHHVNSDPTLGFRGRWKERFAASKRIRNEIGNLRPEGLLIVDGWEQLARFSRWHIARAADGRKMTLLVTAHHRLPGWTAIHETQPTPKLIRSLANDLLDDSPFELKKQIDDDLKKRALTPATNVRELWFELYDFVEDTKR